jgi:hypothetical protein
MGSMGTATRDDLLDTLTGLASRRSPEELKALVQALSGLDQPDQVDERRWGPAPRNPARTRFENIARLQAKRAEVLADAVTREQAARLLGVSPQQVSNLLDSAELVGVRDRGRWALPRWQFTADRTLPMLRELIRAYPGGAVGLSLWATSPSVDLSGLTPAQALATGDCTEAIHAAQALDAAAW